MGMCFGKIKKTAGNKHAFHIALETGNVTKARRPASLSLLLTQEQWAQDALRRCLPPPISIIPKPGELILICAQRPHAVVGFDVGQRISMQTFVESKGVQKSLILES